MNTVNTQLGSNRRIPTTWNTGFYGIYTSAGFFDPTRFFPHFSRACTGMLFDTLERAVELMRKASTSTGLRTTVNVIRRIYETGRNATDAIKDQIRSAVRFHNLLPKWNYTIAPENGQ